MTILLLFLTALWSGTAVYINKKRLEEKKCRDFWYLKWETEMEEHLVTTHTLSSVEEGVHELVESYEMDRLTSGELLYVREQTIIELTKTIENMTESILILYGETQRY